MCGTRSAVNLLNYKGQCPIQAGDVRSKKGPMRFALCPLSRR
jgi:hypothetical protein